MIIKINDLCQVMHTIEIQNYRHHEMFVDIDNTLIKCKNTFSCPNKIFSYDLEFGLKNKYFKILNGRFYSYNNPLFLISVYQFNNNMNYQRKNFKLTQPDTAVIFKRWQTMFNVNLLTARGFELSSLTNKQLKRNKIDMSPKTSYGKERVHMPTRSMRSGYQMSTFYCGGYAKSDMLKEMGCFVYDKFIVIDDNLEELKMINEDFPNSLCFHYAPKG